MGYKKALISLGATIRRAEANAQRRHRQWEREQKEQRKLEELKQAAYEVEQYETEVHDLVSVHQECGEPYNWLEISRTTPPEAPRDQKLNESKISKKIERFRPNLFHRIFKTEQKSREKLQLRLKAAIEEDARIFAKLYGEYQEKLSEHTETVSLAKQILQGNLESYRQIISDVEPLQEVAEYVRSVEFKPITKSKVGVVVHLQGFDIVPRQTKTLLKSGKLSVKDTPASKLNDLYLEYVCSSSLRVGREIFALLPVDEVLVDSVCKMLDPSTGRMASQTILSVLLVRETVNNLDFHRLNPSDSLRNFKHVIDFKKTSGLSPVAALS